MDQMPEVANDMRPHQIPKWHKTVLNFDGTKPQQLTRHEAVSNIKWHKAAMSPKNAKLQQLQ